MVWIGLTSDMILIQVVGIKARYEGYGIDE
jgi:hypothetical protein